MRPDATSPPYSLWVALALSAVGTTGSLYLTMVAGYYACPLCFYQRSFMMGVLAVLLIGILTRMNSVIALSTLAMPLAFAGLGVALWHVHLERADTFECPAGLFGISTAPQQSAIVFGLLAIALLLDSGTPDKLGNGFLTVNGAAFLGIALAAGCVLSASQPKRIIPLEEYESPPKICRPPRAD